MKAPSSPRIEPLEARIAPASFVWDGSASTDWFTAANWTPDGIPGAADTAELNNGALTINLASPATVAVFRQSAGILTGSATLSVLTSLEWSGGSMAGPGVTQIAGGATLSITGAATKTLDDRTVSNAGAATWSGGMLDFTNTATFLNSGSFVAQSDSPIRSITGSNRFDNLAGGAFTNNTGTTGVGVEFTNAGTVTVPSGALNFTGAFSQTAGATRLTGGSLTTSTVLNFAGGELTGAGTITGAVANTGASVSPGGSAAGLLAITGNYMQGSGGTLRIDVGGTAPGTGYDRLNVGGAATLDGTLAVTILPGFTPATGTVFDAIVAGTRSGNFVNVTGEGLLTTTYTATQARLTNNAIVYVWDGSASSDWFTAANWTPAGVPGTADAAVLNSGTIDLSASTSVGSFQQDGGTFTSPANVTLTSVEGYQWTSGTMAGSGVTQANGGLLLNGAFTQLFLDGRTLNVPAGQSATMSGTGTTLFLQNGARFNNAGTFLVQNDTSISPNGGAASLFNNSGTFTRSAGTGVFEIQVPFANSGTVNVQTGTVTLGGGQSGATGGDFNVSAGAILNFTSNFTLAATADVAGAGTVDFSSGTVSVGGSFAIPAVQVSGGTANFNVPTSGLQTLAISSGTASFNTSDTINLSTLSLTGGTLSGTNTINVAGLATWTSGTMAGSGVTQANGGLLLNGAFTQLFLDGRTLNVPAGQSATMSGTGTTLFLQNGARFNNAGTFLVQNDTSISPNGGAASLFNNSGTFTRSAGTGVFEIQVPFANSGTVNVQTGTVTLGGGQSGATGGDFNVSAGAILNFTSNFTLAATADVAGAGTVDFSSGTVSVGGSFAIPAVQVSGGTANFNVPTSGLQTLAISSGTASFNTSDTINLSTLSLTGGTLSGTNTINVAGLATWTSGTMAGSGVTQANGGLLLNGAFTQLFLDGRTLNVPAGQSATMSGTGTTLFLQNGARFNNAGTFLVQNDTSISPNGGAASLFNNSGTFTRSAGTGVFEIQVPFANSGTVNVQTGTVTLGGGQSGATGGDFNVSAGAILNFTSNFTLAATADVAGAGTVDFSSGTVSVGGSFAIPAVQVSGGTANFNVPTSGLQTLAISSGTASFNTSDTINLSTLSLTGGTLSGTNTINVAGLATWTSGTMAGSGVTQANGGLLLNGAFTQLFLDGRTLNVPAGQSATMSGTGTTLFLQNGARFNNAGTFLVQNDTSISPNGGAASLFNNSGTFTRSAGTGVFEIQVPFANSGTVNVQTGSFSFQSDFTQSASGAITGGRPVSFTGGVVNAGGTITAAVSISGATLSPGENGAGELVINGNYVQTGGTFRAEIAGAAAGQSDKLTINGTAALAGTLDLVLLGGFVPPSGLQFNVLGFDANTGTFTNQTGAPGFTQSYQATGLVVGRAGVDYTWDAGGGVDTSWFNALNWNPNGLPDVGDSATLSSSATITVSSPASVGSFTQNAGILTGASTLTAGTFTWTAGTQAGAGMTIVPADGAFNLGGAGLKALTTRTLEQRGTGVWTGSGNLQLGNGATFSNSGTFEIQNDVSLQVAAGGAQPLVTNSGTIHKSAGAGTTTFSGMRFENTGEVLLTSGTLSFAGATTSFTQIGGATRLEGGSLSAVPLLSFAGGVLSGAGSITGSVANTGALVQPGGFGVAGTLIVTGNYTQGAGATLDLEIGGTAPGAQHDVLTVGGTASLGGTLEVSFLNGFTPGSSDVFGVLGAATRTGTFSTVNGAGLVSASYTATQARLVAGGAPLLPVLSVDDVSVTEGNAGTTNARFIIRLSEPSAQTVTVQVVTINVDTDTSDFTPVGPTQITFAPGEVSQPVDVAITGDATVEQNETFFLNLSSPINAELPDAQAQGTILNDDQDVVIRRNGQVAVLTDVDGDRVTVTTNQGRLRLEDFVMAADGSLQMIDLAGDARLRGANLTITAETRPGGDGQVDVGMLDARGLDLGKVTIDGALEMIMAGDGNRRKPALTSLTVASLGQTTPLAPGEDFLSVFRGSVGKITVRGDVQNAAFEVQGRLGRVTIGGNLIGEGGAAAGGIIVLGVNPGVPVGAAMATSIGTFKVEGNVDGGAVVASGNINSVEAGADVMNGAVIAAARIKVVRILRDLTSDDPADPVIVAALGRAGSATPSIDNLIVRGDVENAQILLGYRRQIDGNILPRNADARVGNVIVNGDWTASSLTAGVLDATSDGFGQNDNPIDGGRRSLASRIASIVIRGTATGSAALGDHFGITAESIGKLTIDGDRVPLAGPAKADRLLDEVNGDFRVVELRRA